MKRIICVVRMVTEKLSVRRKSDFFTSCLIFCFSCFCQRFVQSTKDRLRKMAFDLILIWLRLGEGSCCPHSLSLSLSSLSVSPSVCLFVCLSDSQSVSLSVSYVRISFLFSFRVFMLLRTNLCPPPKKKKKKPVCAEIFILAY